MASHRRSRRLSSVATDRRGPFSQRRIRPRRLWFETLEDRRVLDAAVPTLVDLLPASDSGLFDDDNSTNIRTATIEITAAEAGEAIRVYRDAELVGEAAHHDGLLYRYTFAVGQLAEGSNTITARGFDGVAESADSPPLVITLDTLGPRIVAATPSAPVDLRAAALDSITMTFNEPINAGSFTVDDVAIQGPAGAIPPTDITADGADQFQIHFAPQTVRGTYRVTVGPEVADLSGNLMDQDNNGTPGEATDAYQYALAAYDADAIFTTATTIAEGNTTYENQHLLINGTTLTINGPHNFGSVHLINGGVLTHSANTASATYKLDLTVIEGLIIDAFSRIDVTGKGYLPGRTTGNIPYGESWYEYGGSYGGLGTHSSGSPSNPVYGDYADPDDLGSGGAIGFGTAGGGLVRITAALVDLDGVILANGAPRISGTGSGGGIKVSAETVRGTGRMEASGGGNADRAVGGGGRIAVYAGDFSDFDLSAIQAKGGSLVPNAYGSSGSAGTVYLRDTDESRGQLIIDNSSRSPWIHTPLGISDDALTIADDVVIQGSETRAAPEHAGMTIHVNGTLSVRAGAKLSHLDGPIMVEESIEIDGATLSATGITTADLSILNDGLLTTLAATTTAVHKLDVEVSGTIFVDATSRIDVTGKGYLPGRITGNAAYGEPWYEYGGSYGGLGSHSSGTPSNPVYGDYADPDDWGSGGARFGTAGGGLVRIAADQMHLDGVVLANGGDKSAGTGSGGGIKISTAILRGTGTIEASGGGNADRMVGGGGRIAVYAGDFSDFDLSAIQAKGGSLVPNAYGSSGSAGTVYLRDTDESRGQLIIDNSSRSPWIHTPLGLPSIDGFTIDNDVVIRGSETRAAPEHAGVTIHVNGTLSVRAGAKLSHLDGPITVGESIEIDGATLSATRITTTDLSILNGATLYATGITTVDLSILNDSRLTTLAATTTAVHKLDVEVSGMLFVDATSSIDVTGKGYVPGRTTGNAAYGEPWYEYGGSYGGLGSHSSGTPSNPVYGDYADPDDWGSGGARFGTAGGGLVRIAADEMHLDGVVLANGGDKFAGTGSGGGIKISTAILRGTGTIEASGGGNADRMVGGGGRIAVYAGDFSDFDLSAIQAKGGSLLPNAYGSSGSEGTVYLIQGRSHTHVRQHEPFGRQGDFVGKGNNVIPGKLDAVTLTFNKPLDLASFNSSSIVVNGPLGPIRPTGLTLVGDRKYRIELPYPLAESGSYHFAVLPTILDLEGFPLDQDADGVPGEPEDAYRCTLHLDTVPPRVTNHTGGDYAGTLDAVDIWFSEVIDKESFTAADLAVRRPDGQPVAVGAVQEVGLNRFRVSFPSQTQTGTYQVLVGPDVRDLAGNHLDLDMDGQFGEPDDDVYDAWFNMVPVDLGLGGLQLNVSQLWVGDPVTVSWSGRNESGAPLLGEWLDAVYLSADDQWDIGDTLLATVPHTGGLAENEPYGASTDVVIPGRLAGDYHILVRSDIANQQGESDEANNIIATGLLPLGVHELPLGVSASGQLTTADRRDYYTVRLGKGESLIVKTDAAGSEGRMELYVSFNSIPTRLAFDERSAAPGVHQEITLTGISGGGTYYVLVYGEPSSGTLQYTVTADKAPFFVTDVTPRRHGTAAPASLTITGAGFDSSASVELLDVKGVARSLPSRFVSATTLVATLYFDPERNDLWPPDVYTVRVVKGANSTDLPGCFEIVAAGEARLETNLVVPGALSPGFPVKQTLWVECSNSGDIAAPAPLLQVTADGNGLLTADESLANALQRLGAVPSGLGSSVQVMAVGSSATPGYLQPGESTRIPIYYVGLLKDVGQGGVTFSLGSLTAQDTTEKAAYVSDPDERLVYERPRSGRRDINVYEAVWPYHAIRSGDTGTGIVSARSSGSGGGGAGASLPTMGPPPNCYEEYLTIDWYDIRDHRPPTIPGDAWDSILYSIRRGWGDDTTTRGIYDGDLWATYVTEMAGNANYLGEVGQTTSSVGAIWGLEVAEASAALNPIRYLAGAVDVSIPAPGLPLTFSRVYGQSLPSRFRDGPLGRGWSHNWDIRVIRQPGGDVVLRGPGGVDRYFTWNSKRTYTAAPGDYGKLTRSGEIYRLTEKDGTIWQFNDDQRLEYVEDTNGNRITLGYQSGGLTNISHSSGQQILLEYQDSDSGESYLSRLTDMRGPGSEDDGVTLFQYDFDPNGPYLRQVIAPGDRLTEYSYAPLELVQFKPTGPRGDTNPAISVPDPRSHALTSVTYPDGTHDYFSYDDRGWLTGTFKDGGAERVTFGYPGEGAVTVTDPTGRTSTLYFGLGGQLAQVRDAEGRMVSFDYDSDYQLAQLVGPGGERYRYGYDAFGNLTETRDALNLQTQFSYTSEFNQLDSFTDARGNGIHYQYDPATGNLTSIVYQDGTHEDFTYDPLGNVLTATNRRGQTVTYTYNSDGQITSKDYDTTPAVVDYVYQYDAVGNLTEAVDAVQGTTTMAYNPVTDLLELIEYSNGKFFKFAYDTVGRRTMRTDQDGGVVNYGYDGIGRLDRMTDGSGALIVDYDYDAAGRLSRKTLGNGVYTLYDYDPAGHILHLINHQPDGSVLSRFDYTYDVSGRRTSMTTLEGTYEHGYDALGQLTSVRYPDGRLVIYDYDAAGNRRQVIDDGVVTSYSTNGMNQYVTVGGVVYEYDLDGNLISKIESGVATTYSYDIENRLIGVATPTDTWTYSYDAFGNRIGSTHNGVATQYVIDPTGLGNLAAEYDGDGALIARYDHGYGLLSRVDAVGDSAYYTFQAIGHTSELTDASGAVLNSYVYDPWGESLAKTEVVANPFEYVGEYGVMNEGSELKYMRKRLYEPRSGRFISADPAGVHGGLNLYRYVRNRPADSLDPNGQWPSGTDFGDVSRLPRVKTVDFSIVASLTVLPLAGSSGCGSCPFDVPDLGFTEACNAHDACYKSLESKAFCDEKFRLEMHKIAEREGWLHHLAAELYYYGVKYLGWYGYFKSWFSFVVSWYVNFIRSRDPNDKLAPSGFGEAGYIQTDSTVPYTIRFENLAEATGPARQIVVRDAFDADLDLDTFELTEIVFANQMISVAPGFDHYDALVPMNANGRDILVEVRAVLDHYTRELMFSLRAIDPGTGWFPEDPLIGILYPNDETHRGEGSISYTVKPNAGLPSGTEIHNRASIVFDYNDAIDTPMVLNTLDAGPPSSSVVALPESVASFSFEVAWTGEDDAGGSGIAGFDIYVSEDGGPFTPWLVRTTETQATFFGQADHTYAFYSVAVDHVGHRELPPESPDAGTTISFPTDPRVVSLNVVVIENGAVVQVVFSEPMELTARIADGSILDAVTLVSFASGPVTLSVEQFAYDVDTRTMTVAISEPLPGYYSLLLDGWLIADVAGSPLRGGWAGPTFLLPEFGALEVLKDGEEDLAVAGYSVPSLADWNSNGLFDLIVGELSAGGEGKVRVYLNTGTAAAPAYDAFFYAQANGADLVVLGDGCLGVAPRLVDWDGDGLKDLVIGLADGRVQLFLNVGMAENPQLGPGSFLQVGPADAKVDIDVGGRATVEIVDWNNNGRYDLVVGGLDGRVRVYLNEAAAGPADFHSELIVLDGATHLIVPGGRASVSVVDLNDDGRKDLVLGNTEGQLLFFANHGTDAVPMFAEYKFLQADGATIDLPGTPRSRPFVGDWNGDGVPDLLVGAADGLVRLYLGHRDSPIAGDGTIHYGELGEAFTVTFSGNPPPMIGALTASPDPVTRPGQFTLTAEGVSDPDGTVVRVEFYRGEQLLGVDEDGSNGWSFTVATVGWTLGEHTFSARAHDDDGAWSGWESAIVTVENAVPLVSSITAAPNPVTRPGAILLTAEGVSDADGTVSRVEFYLGTISDDTRLGTVEANGPWVLAPVGTAGWAPGEHTLLARAQDNDGGWSSAVTTIVVVENAAPVVAELSVSPDPVTRPGEITLSATGVYDPDGTVARVEFYHGELLLGVDEDGSDGWSWTGSTAAWDLGENTLSALAVDNDGASSPMVSAAVRVYAELEPVDFGGVPIFVTRVRSLNVHNDGTGPLLVEGFDLALPFSIRPVQELDGGDDWIVVPGATKAFIISYLPTENGWHQATLTMIGDLDGRVVQIGGWAASGWQNPVNPFDVNGDGYVTPQDVLLLINEINRGGGEGPLAPRTPEQPGAPFFLDVLGNGYLTPNDVLQVINYINRGGIEQEPSGEGAEGEPDGDRAPSGNFGWLAMVEAAGSSATAGVVTPSTGAAPQSALRIDWLTAAVDELAYRTTYRQQDLPYELDKWQRREQRRGINIREAGDSGLPEWEALLDHPAMDLTDLDAYFAALR